MPKEYLTKNEFLAIAVLTAENMANHAPDADFFEECDDLEVYGNYTLTEYKGKYHILQCDGEMFIALPPQLSGLYEEGECPMGCMDLSKISLGWDYADAKRKWDALVAYLEDGNSGLGFPEWLSKKTSAKPVAK